MIAVYIAVGTIVESNCVSGHAAPHVIAEMPLCILSAGCGSGSGKDTDISPVLSLLASAALVSGDMHISWLKFAQRGFCNT